MRFDFCFCFYHSFSHFLPPCLFLLFSITCRICGLYMDLLVLKFYCYIDRCACITFGNYKIVNVKVQSYSEIETVNVIQEEILLNIEIVENLYKNLEIVNITLEEFSNPTILEEHVNQENFVDIMCKNYTDEQIIEQLYKTNLI